MLYKKFWILDFGGGAVSGYDKILCESLVEWDNANQKWV